MLYWGGKSLLNPEPTVRFTFISSVSAAPTVIKVIESRASLFASVPSPSSLFPAEIGHLSADSLPPPRGEEHWLADGVRGQLAYMWIIHHPVTAFNSTQRRRLWGDLTWISCCLYFWCERSVYLLMMHWGTVIGASLAVQGGSEGRSALAGRPALRLLGSAKQKQSRAATRVS